MRTVPNFEGYQNPLIMLKLLYCCGIENWSFRICNVLYIEMTLYIHI